MNGAEQVPPADAFVKRNRNISKRSIRYHGITAYHHASSWCCCSETWASWFSYWHMTELDWTWLHWHQNLSCFLNVAKGAAHRNWSNLGNHVAVLLDVCHGPRLIGRFRKETEPKSVTSTMSTPCFCRLDTWTILGSQGRRRYGGRNLLCQCRIKSSYLKSGALRIRRVSESWVALTVILPERHRKTIYGMAYFWHLLTSFDIFWHLPLGIRVLNLDRVHLIPFVILCHWGSMAIDPVAEGDEARHWKDHHCPNSNRDTTFVLHLSHWFHNFIAGAIAWLSDFLPASPLQVLTCPDD